MAPVGGLLALGLQSCPGPCPLRRDCWVQHAEGDGDVCSRSVQLVVYKLCNQSERNPDPAQGTQVDNALTHLDLGVNKISDQGALALGKALGCRYSGAKGSCHWDLLHHCAIPRI